MLEASRTPVAVREEDYQLHQSIGLQRDVYNLTICAYMTKCCTPVQQSFALKQCIFVYIVQILAPLFFFLETKDDPIADPEANAGAIRLICCLLLHMIILPEVQKAMGVLRYLKYVKTAPGGRRGRMINIMLCCMQISSPIFAEIILILSISKNFRLQMIIKTFVALGFVTSVDDKFADHFPEQIIEKRATITLHIGKDQNSVTKIRARLNRRIAEGKPANYIQTFMNLFVNIVFFLFSNFYAVLYYYFFPFLGVIIQFLLFFSQEVNT